MLHFPILERHGVTACLSEKSDGDATRDGACEMFPGHERLTMLQQVHGTMSIVSDESNDDCEGDAIILSAGSPPGVIRVADCVPVWIYEPESGVGAVIHAGREGTRLGIVALTLGRLIEEFGAVAERVVAVIGPSAGVCCYEVSIEMAEAFEAAGGVREGRMLDLWSTNRNQLLTGGVSPGNVDVTSLCTICCGRFHSYRGEQTSARNAAFLHIPGA